MRKLVALTALVCSNAMADLYIPITAQHINAPSKLNEQNFGLGYGKDGKFVMGFKDSLGKPSYMAGVNKEWVNKEGLGAGAAVFTMTRSNVHHYQPFLGALPYLSYKKEGVSLIAAYLPKVSINKVDAVFFMIRIE